MKHVQGLIQSDQPEKLKTDVDEDHNPGQSD